MSQHLILFVQIVALVKNSINNENTYAQPSERLIYTTCSISRSITEQRQKFVLLFIYRVIYLILRDHAHKENGKKGTNQNALDDSSEESRGC